MVYFILDLPPELLDRVLEEFALSNGITAALKLQVVCKAFESGTVKALCRLRVLHTPGIRLPEPYSGYGFAIQYVKYWVLSDGDRKQNLSRRLNRVMDAVTAKGTISADVQDKYWHLLIRCVLGENRLSRVLEALDFDPYREDENTRHEEDFHADCLAASALFGIEERFDEIASRAIVDVPGTSDDATVLELRLHSSTGCVLANNPLLGLLARGGHHDLVSKLLNDRLDPPHTTLTEGHHYGLLLYAIYGGHEATVRLCASYYKDTPLEDTFQGTTPMKGPMWDLCLELGLLDFKDTAVVALAAYYGRQDVVERCIASGVCLDMTNYHPDWYTAICAACRTGRTEIVRLLIAKGADRNHGRLYGPPVSNAAIWGSPEIMEILLDAGARTIDEVNNSPLLIAISHHNWVVAEYILRKWPRFCQTTKVKAAARLFKHGRRRLLGLLSRKFTGNIMRIILGVVKERQLEREGQFDACYYP